MGSQAQDPAKERKALLERVQKLEACVRSLLPDVLARLADATERAELKPTETQRKFYQGIADEIEARIVAARELVGE